MFKKNNQHFKLASNRTDCHSTPSKMMFRVIPEKIPQAKMTNENQNIQVFIRCRPLKENEKRSKIDLLPDNCLIKAPQRTYMFDNVYDGKATQLCIYKNVVSPLVEEVIEGYNCTVFAYGQTGTGKTHTMVGYKDDKNVSWENDPSSGIIPRAIDQLLDLLQDSSTEFSIRVSFLELYNEEAYDLLCPLSDNTKLKIYQDQERKGSVVISGLTEIPVATKKEIYDVLEKGSIKRQTAPTLMNALSSRSHTIFSVTVHIKEITDEQEEIVKVGKLNLVDLAGSENVGRSGAVEDRARETSNINKSLLTLGRVITSLVDKMSHIPYRDSKLTRLLQDSLGGKTKTSIIATISPSIDDYEDTISTLDYAQRAKKITNKPEVNLKLKKGEVISNYLKEIERLRRDLEASRDKKGRFVDSKNYDDMVSKLEEQEKIIQEQEAEETRLKTEIENWQALEVELKMSIDVKDEENSELKFQLDKFSSNLKAAKIELEQSRIQLEQNRVIIEAHIQAERKLLSEANKVKEITDQCVNDNSKLFDKIHNLKNLQQTSIQGISEYFENFNKHFELVQSFNSMFGQRYIQSFETLQNLAKTHNIQMKCDEANKLSNNFAKLFNQFKGDMESSLKNERDTSSEFQKSTLDGLENLKFQLCSFQKSFQNSSTMMSEQFQIIQTVIGETINQRQKVEQIYLDLDTKLKSDTKNFQISLDSLKTDIRNIIQQKGASNENVQGQIQSLREFQKTCFQQWNEKFAILEDIIAGDHEKSAQTLKHASIKCEVISNDFRKQNEANIEIISELDQSGQRHAQKVVDIGSELQKTLISQQESIASQIDAHCHLNGKLVNELEGSLEHHITDTLDEIYISRKEYLENFINVADEFSKANLNTISEINVASKLIDTEMTNAVDKETRSLGLLLTNQNEHLTHCDHVTQEFCTSKLPCYTYQETGKTPQRTCYSYPQKFTKTSPHPRIIARVFDRLSTNQS